MKNFYKMFGIIVLVAVIGFSFTACDEPEDEGSDDVPKTLVITGINVTGTKIVVGIADQTGNGKTNLKAYSEVNLAANVTIPLLSAKNRGEAYTGTGKSYIMLIIDEDDAKTFFWTNNTTQAFKYDIQEAVTTLPFSEFRVLN